LGKRGFVHLLRAEKQMVEKLQKFAVLSGIVETNDRGRLFLRKFTPSIDSDYD